MARRKRTVEEAVEEQCAAIRTLAHAMRLHSDSLGWINRREAQLIEGWAGLLDSTAIALAEALRDADAGGLGRLWRAVTPVVVPLLAVQGAAVDALSLWDHLAAEPKVVDAAEAVVDIAGADCGLIDSWSPSRRQGTAIDSTASETGRLVNDLNSLQAGINEMRLELAQMGPPDGPDPERLEAQWQIRREMEDQIRHDSIRVASLAE